MLDLYLRKVMAPNMPAELVCTALQMGQPKSGLIVHTDRGSQYASQAHRDLLARNGLIASMSRKGNCWALCGLIRCQHHPVKRFVIGLIEAVIALLTMPCGRSPWCVCVVTYALRYMWNDVREKAELLRRLKRYIVRELYPLILADLADTTGFG